MSEMSSSEMAEGSIRLEGIVRDESSSNDWTMSTKENVTTVADLFGNRATIVSLGLMFVMLKRLYNPSKKVFLDGASVGNR